MLEIFKKSGSVCAIMLVGILALVTWNFSFFLFVGLLIFPPFCVVCPKKPSKNVVNIDSINHIINYNKLKEARIDDHPRVTHNLLGYTPININWKGEKSNQPDWVGPSKRPKKLEDRQKVRPLPPPHAAIPSSIVIQEGPAEERDGVTLARQFLNLGGPSSFVVGDKGKGIDVKSPQNNSITLTDPEILDLFEGLKDITSMPPKRRNIGASLQVLWFAHLWGAQSFIAIFQRGPPGGLTPLGQMWALTFPFPYFWFVGSSCWHLGLPSRSTTELALNFL